MMTNEQLTTSYRVFYYDRPYEWICIPANKYKNSPNPVRLIFTWEGVADSPDNAIRLAKVSAKDRGMF